MAQDLFSYIKQKAVDAANAVGSFVTQNPTPAGFIAKQANNAIPGGFSGGMQRVKNVFANPETAVPQEIPSFFPRQATHDISQYVQNNYTVPMLSLPKSVMDLLGRNSTPEQRVKGGIGALTGAAALTPDPVFDIAVPAVNLWKGYKASAIRGGNIPQNVQAAVQSATYEKPVGLGTSLTTNPTGETVGNISELPLMLAAGIARGKGGTKTIDEILSTAKTDKAGNIVDKSVIRALDMLPKTGKRSFFEAFKGNVPKETLALPQPQQSVTIAQLQQLAKQGDNLQGVSFIPRNAEEARAALRLGLPADKIQMPKVTAKGTAPLYATEEGISPTRNPVSTELLNAHETVKKTASELKKAIFPRVKGTLERAKDYLIGDSSLKGARGVIENDSPAGKAVMQTVSAAESKVADLAGRDKATMQQALGKLSDQELSTFADVVEGKAPPVSQAQAQAVTTWRQVAQNIHDLATETGMKVGNITDYFPHFISKEGKIALDESQFIDRGANLDYGNLVKSRTADTADFIKDPNVIFDYISHAYDNIVKRSYFGESDKYLYDMAGKTSNPSQVRSILDTMLGKGPQGGFGSTLSKMITSAETTKMGFLSPLTNLTQQMSSVARTDIPTAFKTYKNMIQNPEGTLLNAIKAGEVEAEVGGKLVKRMAELKDASLGRKWLEIIRFNQAEKMNRVFSVNAGMEYATKLIGQAKSGSEAAVRELGRLGIDALKATEQDIIRAGRKISQETQFATRKGGLPQGWETPAGRVATQFKSFAYKQTGFLKEQVARVASEASKGNLAPLGTLLAAYGVGSALQGEIINDVRSLVTNKKRDADNPLERYLQNVAAGSSLGLLDNLPGLTGQYGEAGFVSSLAGPFAGDVVKFGKAVGDASKGAQDYDVTKSVRENLDPESTTSRFVLGSIPGVGKAISNTAVPNSYVENFIGPNVGLNRKDTQTFKNIKESGGDAEAFREKQQMKRDTAPTFWDKVTGKKTPLVVPDKTSTPAEKKEFDIQVYNMLDAGAVPSKEQISHTILKGRKANSPLVEERNGVYKSIKSAVENDRYTDEQKAAIVEASGASPENVDYYLQASKDKDVKIQEIMPKVSNMSGEELLTYLTAGRRAVGGSQLITSEIITYLYDNNVIGKDEKEMLNALKFDEGNGKFYFSRGFSEGGTKKISFAQAKKFFNLEIPSFSKMQKALASSFRQSTNSGDTLVSEILGRKPKKFVLKK